MVYLLVFSGILFTGILIFKGLTARRLYKSFGVKGLKVVHTVLWLLISSRGLRTWMNVVMCSLHSVSLYSLLDPFIYQTIVQPAPFATIN
jgi:hypothetical protein